MRLEWRHVSISDGKPSIFTSLTGAEATELARLARNRERVLEIGSAFGYSAIVMGLSGNAEVWSVDPHTGHSSLQEFAANVDTFGLTGRVKICVGTSQEAAVLRNRSGGLEIPEHYFDMVFVDGDHTLEGVRHDRDWARRLVKPYGAVIAFHDYDEATCPGIKPGLDEWKPPSFFVDTLAVYSDPR